MGITGIMPAQVKLRDLVAQSMEMVHKLSSPTNISEFFHSSIQYTYLKYHWAGTELNIVGDTKIPKTWFLPTGAPAGRWPQVTETG